MNDLTSQQSTSVSHRRRWLALLISLPIALGRDRRGGARDHRVPQQPGGGCGDRTVARGGRAGGQRIDGVLVSGEHVAGGHGCLARDPGGGRSRSRPVDLVNSLPIVGTGELPDDLVPGGKWADEPKIAEFLREVHGRCWHRSSKPPGYPAPVWQPIAFDSFATLLPRFNRREPSCGCCWNSGMPCIIKIRSGSPDL
jgi:hypothetical protein